MTRLRGFMLDWRADSSSAERDKALQVRSGTPLADFAPPLADFAPPLADFVLTLADFAPPLADFAPPLADFALPLLDRFLAAVGCPILTK